jgi:hypothetical protein
LEHNGERLFHQFKEGPEVKGPEDENPAIDWFIDLLFEGKQLPGDPEGLRSWLRRAGGGRSRAAWAALCDSGACRA